MLARGIAWFSFYVLLTVAPAAVAAVVDPFPDRRPALVEVSVALGLLAFPLVLAQFALVSRLRAASRPFGTDALVQFHRYMGFLAFAFAVAHPALLHARGLPWSAWSPLSGNPVFRTGAIATWAIAALVVTTVLRRRLGLSYEAWRSIHLVLSITAAGALVGHILAVGGYSGPGPMRAVLAAYVLAAAGVLVAYRLVRPLRLRSRPWTVVDNLDRGASTRTLRVRPAGHAGFAFEPGQFAWLITGASPFSSQQHPLSVASSAERPADGSIEFAIKALGDWSSVVVPGLAAGARVWVEGAFGAFTTEGRGGQGFVLIAGGIGIAPVRSMLLSMRDRGDRRHVVLLYAAHDETRAPFRQEIESLRAELNLDVVYVFESPPEAWTGERGVITSEVLRRHLPPHYRRYHYFVCGPPPMMDAVEALLIEAGVAPAAIDSERFQVV